MSPMAGSGMLGAQLPAVLQRALELPEDPSS
jgi:hypothetical protein